MAFNQLTVAEAERLALLGEELGEAQQAVGKILRHGYASYNPDDESGPSNRQALEMELGDIQAAVTLMTRGHDVLFENIELYKDKKLPKMGKYLHHQSRYILTGERVDAHERNRNEDSSR